MIRAWLIALILGGLLGYGIAYARFGDANVVDELRGEYKRLADEFEQQAFQLSEYREQNVILKERAHGLVKQNEDYAKIVSQLNRYYYHLNQASEKVKELVDILHIDESSDLHRSLMRMDIDDWMPMELDVPPMNTANTSQEKRFF